MRNRLIRGMGIALVILTAASLRWVSLHGTQVEVPVRADAAQYVGYAYNMRSHGVYSDDVSWRDAEAAPLPDTRRPPGYPLFLALFLDGPPDDAFETRVRRAQAVLGVVTVIAGMLLGWMLFSYGAGLVAGLMLALSPQLVIYESYLLTESLSALLVALMGLAAAGALMLHSPRRRLGCAVAFGALLGLSILVRPTLLYLPVVLFAAGLLIPRAREFRGRTLAALIGCVVLVMPWMVHNLTTSGRISDPALAIGTLHSGSFPDFMYNGDPKTFGRAGAHDPRQQEVSQSTGTVLREIARKVDSDPLTYMHWYVLGKPYYFFSLEEVAGWGWVFIYPVHTSPFLGDPLVRALSSVMTGLHWPVVALTIAGLFAVWWPGARRLVRNDALHVLRLFALIFAFVIAVHVAGTPLPRYSVPFRPLSTMLMLFAASGIVRWVAALRANSRAAHASQKPR